MVKSHCITIFFSFLGLFLASCTSDRKEQLSINFSADSNAIVFDSIDQAGLLQLKNARLSDSALTDLIAVLQTPSERDSDIKEMPVAGHIHINSDHIIFQPDTPFVKGRDYLVITHLNARFGDAAKIMKGKLHTTVLPVQKMLTR